MIRRYRVFPYQTQAGEEILISGDDGPRSCQSESLGYWKCSRLKDHKGPHVACFFSERDGHPTSIIEEWSDEG